MKPLTRRAITTNLPRGADSTESSEMANNYYDMTGVLILKEVTLYLEGLSRR